MGLQEYSLLCWDPAGSCSSYGSRAFSSLAQQKASLLQLMMTLYPLSHPHPLSHSHPMSHLHLQEQQTPKSAPLNPAALQHLQQE
jgi:hypothetical protein